MRKRITLIMAAFIFALTGCASVEPDQEKAPVKGWDTFIADHQPVTEEEYLDAVSRQDQKQNAEWYEFTDENINTLL